MAALQDHLLVFLVITGLLEIAAAVVTRLNSNPNGNYATGYKKGYINLGNYAVTVPDGVEEISREVLIQGPGVKDSVDMIFNSNTMVFCDWDGMFRLGEYVYTDKPGVLYYPRIDKMCIKKKYQIQGDDTRVIEKIKLDMSICEAVRMKVEKQMKHYLEYPFQFFLPTADFKLRHTDGFPGGDFMTGKPFGTLYVGQHTIELPTGDVDKERTIQISAPGVKDEIVMKVDFNTKAYGKWDGSFFLGDKVFTDEPKTLVIQKGDGSCVKKYYSERGATIIVADEVLLRPEDCFKIKSKVFADLQNLIGNPKQLAEEKKKKSPAGEEKDNELKPLPIQVTSTVVFPDSSANQPSSPSGSPADSGAKVQISTTTSQHPNNPVVTTTTNIVKSMEQPPTANPQGITKGADQPVSQSPAATSGQVSNVHISTITSQNADNPTITTTHVIKTQAQQQNSATQQRENTNQIQSPPPNIAMPGNVQYIVQPSGRTLSSPIVVRSDIPSQAQQVMVTPSGQVQVLVPADSIQSNTVLLQPGNAQTTQLVDIQPNTDENNVMNIQSQNVNLQDGTLNIGSGSLLIQGLNPNDELILPEGSVRVGRSVFQQDPQLNVVQPQIIQLSSSPPSSGQENPKIYRVIGNTVTPLKSSNGLASTQVTTSNSASSPGSNIQMMQHTTTVNVPSNNNRQGDQTGNQMLMKTNILLNQETPQSTPKIYYIKSPSASSSTEKRGSDSNTVSQLRIIPSVAIAPPPTVINVQGNNAQPLLLSPNTNNQQNQVLIKSQKQDNPVVLTLQQLPDTTSSAQRTSNVNVNVDNSGASVVLRSQLNQGTQDNPTQGISQSVSDTTSKTTGETGGATEAVIKFMKELNLPKPINNLIVNIAENTNFHKK